VTEAPAFLPAIFVAIDAALDADIAFIWVTPLEKSGIRQKILEQRLQRNHLAKTSINFPLSTLYFTGFLAEGQQPASPSLY